MSPSCAAPGPRGTGRVEAQGDTEHADGEAGPGCDERGRERWGSQLCTSGGDERADQGRDRVETAGEDGRDLPDEDVTHRAAAHRSDRPEDGGLGDTYVEVHPLECAADREQAQTGRVQDHDRVGDAVEAASEDEGDEAASRGDREVAPVAEG